MRRSDHVRIRWNVLIGLLMRVVRLAPRWLLPTAVLALTMVLGLPFQSAVVQAQDGGAASGQQATSTYDVVVNSEGVNLDKFCVGRTAHLPVSMIVTITVAGDANVGQLRPRSVNY